jgi:hypothetical protein
VPNVVYEDFKTIQKLEGALRLIGVSEYRSVTTLYPAVDVDHGNRIWICIPRNPPARMELKELGNRVRFTFVNKNEGDESKLVKCVEWRHSNGDTVLARSPLAKYLSQARPAGRRPWDPAFGYIYAKDYAVISRFRLQNPNAHPGKPYYHYFIAGIRGLGTWGAGWYIDRFPDELEKFSKLSRGGDVQILLEVTYCNYRVIAVTDVSDKSQDYFDKEYSNEVIQGHLKRSDNAKRFVRRGKQPKIVNP